MIKKISLRIALSVIFCCYCFFSFAQIDSSATNNNVMMSHDKIYVVMAVCLTILIGLFLYLIRIDTKVSKKEKLL